MRRRFNSGERVALFLAADGRCQRCGAVLRPDWEPDHLLPFAAGGATDVLNGQALCRPCNRKKGEKLECAHLGDWPEWLSLRAWQEEGFQKWLEVKTSGRPGSPEERNDFLCVCCPAGGKTNFALYIAHYLLRLGQVRRVVVICPSAHLRKQWAKAAAKVGIHLDWGWENRLGSIAADMHGVVVTYASVFSQPSAHRGLCRVPTVVIMDEIHHAGDELEWGKALRQAYAEAEFRVLLSGTPFRSDEQRIPFVPYRALTGGGWQCHPDFEYGYGDAIVEDICRYAFFPSYEGDVEWWKDGNRREARLGDPLNERDAADRLRAALASDGDWIGTVLKEANAKLSEVRQEDHPEAAGLILAMDTGHANRIAARLKTLTGIDAVIVHSDLGPEMGGGARSSDLITDFAEGNRPWIIAVRMVSEGVDIPRLRVLVYATNITTWVYFMQALGRIIRTQEGREGDAAFFYLPAVYVLVEYAMAVKEMRVHAIREQLRKEEEEKTGCFDPEGTGERKPSSFIPGASTGEHDQTYHPGGSVGRDHLQEARDVKARTAVRQSIEEIAVILKAYQELIPQPTGSSSTNPPPGEGRSSTVERPPAPPKTLKEQKKSEIARIKKLAGRIAILEGMDHDRPYVLWMTEMGGSHQPLATLEELKRKVRWLEAWLRRLVDGND
jgi:superfamily II DNA or RNA helicase